MIKHKKYPSKECTLVYSQIHQKITAIYKIQAKLVVDINCITVTAKERDLSNELLISRRQARQSCSALVKLGYLKIEKIGRKTQYGLTGTYLDTDILNDVDIENIGDEISELFILFNSGLEYNSVPDELRLQISNPYHIYFLQELLHKVNNEYEKAKELIDVCSKEIYKYNFKKPSARTLANEIHETLKRMSRKSNRIIPDRLYKQPDSYLVQRYHLRKKQNKPDN